MRETISEPGVPLSTELNRIHRTNQTKSEIVVKSNRRRAIGALLMIILVAVIIACEKTEQVKEDEVIVRVGDAVLTLDDLAYEIPEFVHDRITKEEIQDYIVRWMNSQVLYQEAKRQGLDRDIRLEQEMKRVEREMLVSAFIDKNITRVKWPVAESEIRAFYEANKESFTRSEPEIHVWNICVRMKKTADSLYHVLRRGGDDFAVVARQFDQKLGDGYEWNLTLSESEIPLAARRILRSRPGTTISPIELDDGYHIFRIIDSYPSGTIRDLDLVRDDIVRKIQARKREERYRQILAELHRETRTVTNFKMLEGLSIDSLFARAKRTPENWR